MNKPIYFFFFASIILFSCGNNKKVSHAVTGPDAIEEAINLSYIYLSEKVQDDGMFEYRLNMNPEVRLKRKYNILRHCGTVYTMSMYYDHRNTEVSIGYIKAAQYLLNKAIEKLGDNDSMLAVWSKPKVNGSGKRKQAKLGGTGLGLVALASTEKHKPGTVSVNTLRKMGRFIQFMQKENCGFCSKYFPGKGREDKWISFYYPQEAALGMVMLYEADSNIILHKSAYKALAFLANERRDNLKVPADHLALIATEKVLSHEKTAGLKMDRKLLIDHTIQNCESIMAEREYDESKPLFWGGFAIDGRTTPTSTRVEGLIAASSFLPVNHPIQEKLQKSISDCVMFLVSAYLFEGEYAGAGPRATEVRIDYIQHAMCALLRYQYMKNKTSGK